MPLTSWYCAFNKFMPVTAGHHLRSSLYDTRMYTITSRFSQWARNAASSTRLMVAGY